jgi:hypothetical protein
MRWNPRTQWFGLVCAIVAATVAGQPSFADRKVEAVATPLTQSELDQLRGSILQGFSCTIGVTSTPVASIDYILPPDDHFYTYLSPPQCAACAGTNNARLLTAHVVLNIRTLCSMPIEFTIYAADTGCAEPNLFAQQCITTATTLTPTTLGLVDFALPLPDSCQIGPGSFLGITFKSFPTACNGSSSRPLMILTSGGCPVCRSYNYFETERDDLCREPDMLTGQPLFFVEAASCFTPTRPRSWGALKILYR